MDDKAELQGELDQIMKPGGQHHEAWKKGDKGVLEMRESLYRRLYPDPAPEQEKPEGEPPEGEKPEQQAKEKPAEENSAKFDVAAERAAAEVELKERFGDEYQTKMKTVYEARDALFDRTNPQDREVLTHFNGAFGNHPQFIALLADAKDRIEDMPKQRADISGMAEKEKDALAAQFISGILPKLRSPLVQEIYQSIPPNLLPKFRDWAAERGARLYRYETKKGR